MQQAALEKWGQMYGQYFDQLYLYFARRVKTKRLVAFLVEQVFTRLTNEFSANPDLQFSSADLYRWSWELLSTELEKIYGQQKTHDLPKQRIQYFDDVYRLKRDAGDEISGRASEKTFEHPMELDIFYTHLLPMEREVLWLTVFEGLSDLDRARILNMQELEAVL